MKLLIKISLLAVMLAGILFFSMIKTVHVEASVDEITPTPAVVPTLTPTMTPTTTPTMTPTPVPLYTLGKYAGNEYAEYIWAKWAPHGNRAQAVALCTNIAEGHLDDNATGYNTDSDSYDRGCWQFSSLWNPQVTDEQARNCKVATDIAYDKWNARGQSFEGYWYGYGSNNYQLCMNSL